MFKITSVYKAMSVAGCSDKKVMGNDVLLEQLWYVHVEYFHTLCWKHGLTTVLQHMTAFS